MREEGREGVREGGGWEGDKEGKRDEEGEGKR